MKKYLIFFLILSSCSSNQNELENKFFDMNFNESLTFEEFKIKLEEYANNNPYPNISE